MPWLFYVCLGKQKSLQNIAFSISEFIRCGINCMFILGFHSDKQSLHMQKEYEFDHCNVHELNACHEAYHEI